MTNTNTATTEEKTINSLHAFNPAGAAADAKVRNDRAYERFPKFFSSQKRQDTVEKVIEIVNNFFAEHEGIYTNYRTGKKNPFISVKVGRPLFPAISAKKKETAYLEPLRNLGVEPIWSKGTNSWIYRIY